MSRRNAVLGGVLVLQLALVLFLFRPGPKTAPQGEPLFPDLKPNQIVRLTLTDSNDHRVEIARVDRVWALPQADDYPVRREKVISLINKIIGLKSDRLITRTADSHARLKVEEQDFERLIEFHQADGTSHRLYVGTAPSLRAAHVRADGQQAVYLALGFSAIDAPVAASDWVDPVYFSVPPQNVAGFALENGNGRFEFSKGDGEVWALKDLGEGRELDQAAVRTLLALVAPLRMVRPLGKRELDEYGLGAPRASLIVHVSDGEGGSQSFGLTVGAQDNEDGTFAVSSSQSPYIVRAASLDVQVLVETTLEDLLAGASSPTSATSTRAAPNGSSGS